LLFTKFYVYLQIFIPLLAVHVTAAIAFVCALRRSHVFDFYNGRVGFQKAKREHVTSAIAFVCALRCSHVLDLLSITQSITASWICPPTAPPANIMSKRRKGNNSRIVITRPLVPTVDSAVHVTTYHRSHGRLQNTTSTVPAEPTPPTDEDANPQQSEPWSPSFYEGCSLSVGTKTEKQENEPVVTRSSRHSRRLWLII